MKNSSEQEHCIIGHSKEVSLLQPIIVGSKDCLLEIGRSFSHQKIVNWKSNQENQEEQYSKNTKSDESFIL